MFERLRTPSRLGLLAYDLDQRPSVAADLARPRHPRPIYGVRFGATADYGRRRRFVRVALLAASWPLRAFNAVHLGYRPAFGGLPRNPLYICIVTRTTK